MVLARVFVAKLLVTQAIPHLQVLGESETLKLGIAPT